MNAQPTIKENSYLRRWLIAIRPRTLPAAGSPVLIGLSIAWTEGMFRLLPAVVILLCAILLQILANLVNDVADYQKGTDTSARLGPTRVTQSGLLSPRQVWIGAGVIALLAIAGGIYLAWLGGWPVIIIGGLAMLAAVIYTVGPFALADYGLGDLFALFFFGLVTVAGTVYILMGRLTPLSWMGGLGAGALVTAILIVNNVRDIESDRMAGRRNIPVVWGRAAGEREYTIMLALAYVVIFIILGLGWANAWILLPLLSLPRAYQLRQQMRKLQPGPGFNQLLAHTAQLVLIYCVLFSAGILISG
ncbi:MAG: 1 4-dihydroxy-2-naphthoate octaprenyltransferase [Chloroflexi bacterium]|nr:MAG: 1 4-dihydroxy-2-naphthoate octaprenyltransferase [Chloroflexota bacterium]MBA4375407.1 1,4-dihydroxy-2-naphthoate octaprenyltransferase [Anaerolinea sp.]